jgi:hypothetical protein
MLKRAALPFIALQFPRYRININGWMDKKNHLHTMEIYSSIKKGELSFVTVWINLESIMLRKIS